MSLNWPSERDSLRQKTERFRGRTVEDRIRAVSRLFDLHRELMKDPERRKNYIAARARLVSERREAFRSIVE